MKASPLKIRGFEYPVVCVRAIPNYDSGESSLQIAVEVDASVGFDTDGVHFAIISVKQAGKPVAYSVEFEAFTEFEIDVDACKANFAEGWNPSMLAVNVARLLYSGVRELLASITARAPHGLATLPSTTLGPEDVHVGFEENKRDEILAKFFGFSQEKIDALNKRIAEINAPKKPPKKAGQKKKVSRS